MTTVATTSQTQASQSRASGTTGTIPVNSDFDTFLTMLSAQMKNQDPLNPIESTDYATQLATFSAVEQQIKTNELLTQLVARNTATGISGLQTWVGHTVSAPGAVNYRGSPLTLDIRPPAGATALSVEVRQQDGTLVQTLPAPREGGQMQWAGVTADGTPLPNGQYSFTTVGRDADRELGRSATPIYQQVTEARLEGDATKLVLSGGATISPEAIVAIKSNNASTQPL